MVDIKPVRFTLNPKTLRIWKSDRLLSVKPFFSSSPILFFFFIVAFPRRPMQGNRDGSWSLGTSANGGSGNGNDGYLPQSSRVFSNFNFQQPIRYNFQTQHNLNFPHREIPSFPHHQFGAAANGFLQTHVQQHGDSGGSRIHGSSEKSSSKSNRNVEVMRIEKAVNETRKSLVASGENVSSTRVSQSVLAQLQADSFGVEMQNVPSFRQLMSLEGNVSL